mgnify:CR=1 FL=1
MTLAQLVADMKELLKAEGAAGLKMTEEQVDALAADLGSRTFVTKFFDLEPVNGDDNLGTDRLNKINIVNRIIWF